MPRYIVTSEGPISVHQVGSSLPDLPDLPQRPVDPGYGVEEVPPPEVWPPLPPGLEPPGVELPIAPSPEHPMVPIEPDVDPPEIWPPPRPPIEFPDLSGKTLALARIFVSRHVNYLAWIIIDHEEAKEKAKKAIEAIKGKLPAGGVGGRPPQTRPPGT